jgi:hypothetical protein
MVRVPRTQSRFALPGVTCSVQTFQIISPATIVAELFNKFTIYQYVDDQLCVCGKWRVGVKSSPFMDTNITAQGSFALPANTCLVQTGSPVFSGAAFYQRLDISNDQPCVRKGGGGEGRGGV